MLLRDQGKLAFATLREGGAPRSSCSPCPRCSTATTSSSSSTSATGWAPRARSSRPVGASCRSRSGRSCCWPRPAVGFGDKWHGINDADTRYRQRYADLWANPDAAAGPAHPVAASCRLTRRWLEDRDFVEVETPVLQHVASGAAAKPVRHPPQRARRRPQAAHRARAVPQAARRGRLRAGVRDRPGVPQRGHLDPAQPRVHDARAVPGLRRLRRHHGAGRGAGRPPGHRRCTAPPP